MRLLVIDDESVTRNGILRHLDWKRLGITMIQTAASGQEALQLCETFEPDILLSDIRMRGMDGVETCTQLHARYPNAQIIFISGYSDKEYLKAAIELGAVHYVEKPIDMQELTRALEKAVRAVLAIRQQRSREELARHSETYMKRRALRSALESHETDAAFESAVEQTGIFDYARLRVGILRADRPVTNIAHFQAQFDAACARLPALEREWLDHRRCVLLFQGDASSVSDAALSPLVSAIAQPIDGVSLFFALGETVAHWRRLHASFASAERAEALCFSLGYGRACLSAPNAGEWLPPQSLLDAFEHALERGKETEVLAAADAITEAMIRARAVLDAPVRNFCFALDHALSLQFRKLPDTAHYENFGWESADTAEALKLYLHAQIHALFEARQREESGNFAIGIARRYIEENYMDKQLSVQQLAELVYLTPTYLSTLFKRKTGLTVGEYLSTVRMEQAKELLKDKQLKIYHVAERVGYEDANYFARLFKKFTERTPSEYRETLW